MSIITKFTVATEEGTQTLLMLTQTLAAEKYASLLEKEILEQYILEHFNERTLIGAINNMSNLWLVVYAEGQPAGYACMTSKGSRPVALAGKKAIRIADFGVLHAYADPAVKDALLEKCLQVGKSYENIWIHEYRENPLLTFFESNGFTRQEGATSFDGLPLESVFLIK